MLNLFFCACLFWIVTAAPKQDQKLARYLPGGRVIGGEDAKIEDFPYMISITYEGGYLCGGSLISSTWAVTAAHCFAGLGAGDLAVQANSSSVDEGVTATIKGIIINQFYEPRSLDSDIALLELDAPLTCRNCKPIKLSKTAPNTADNVTLVGWGSTDPDAPDNYDYELSPVLQTVKLPVVDRDLCGKNYAGIPTDVVTANMFCAGDFDNGGIDACFGDAGSPVSLNGSLVGIVSWGYKCAQPGYPGVYTLVTNFLNWIQDNSGVSV